MNWGKIKEVVGIGVLSGLMLISVGVGSSSVAEASSKVEKCTLTIDVNQYEDENYRAYATEPCGMGVMGVAYSPDSIWLESPKLVTQVYGGEVLRTGSLRGDWDVTVKVIPLKQEEQPKETEPPKEPEHQTIVLDDKEVNSKETKEVEEKVHNLTDKEQSNVTIYTLQDIAEMIDEGRVSFDMNNNRYRVLVDDGYEKEITYTEAVKLGFLEDDSITGDLTDDVDTEVGTDVEDMELELTEETDTSGTKSWILLGVGIILMAGIGVIVTRLNKSK